jgi:hypothetical protein
VADQLDFRAGSAEQFASGVQRFVIGLGKKVLIANNIGMLWDIYAAQDAASLTFLGAWLGILAFSFQIYFDFSGYSDMAIGLGRMIGFEFRENFNYPYISKSVTEFWRRWHISLSTWFRDYVLYPAWRQSPWAAPPVPNILIVWALTGICTAPAGPSFLWGLYLPSSWWRKGFPSETSGKSAGSRPHLYPFVAVCGWCCSRQPVCIRRLFFTGICSASARRAWSAAAILLPGQLRAFIHPCRRRLHTVGAHLYSGSQRGLRAWRLPR